MSACAILHKYALRQRHGLGFVAQWCDFCGHLVFPVPTASAAQDRCDPSAPVPPAQRGRPELARSAAG